MEIFVYHTPDQVPDLSKQARKGGLQLEMPACAIVIDVLRATTTMATALQSGAEAIQVFDDIDELFRVSKRTSGSASAGRRNSACWRANGAAKSWKTLTWATRRRNAPRRGFAASGCS